MRAQAKGDASYAPRSIRIRLDAGNPGKWSDLARGARLARQGTTGHRQGRQSRHRERTSSGLRCWCCSRLWPARKRIGVAHTRHARVTCDYVESEKSWVEDPQALRALLRLGGSLEVLRPYSDRIRDVRESGDHDQLGPIAVLAEPIDNVVRYRIGEQLPGILQHEPQARNCGKAIVGSPQAWHGTQGLRVRVDNGRLIDRC